MDTIELVAPAGNFEKLKYALAYGADAVYAGVPKFSLRVRDNDFTLENLREAIDYTHQKGKKIYLTLNIYPHNKKLNAFKTIFTKIAKMRPDGIILSDPGVILMARSYCPQLPIHLSTQANTINWMSVKFWQEIGVSRIILSRELSIEEIREIRKAVADIELESFVHGAICIAYSGRCLLSNYFNHRDSNQGTCTNSCRWRYRIYKRDQDHHYLEEQERPNALMPVSEDEFGTYIMNSKDLCTINLLDRLRHCGIDSFKIEGRTKSIYYLSVITRAYRLALDNLLNDSPVDSTVEREIYAVANRGYITGFLEKNPAKDGQNYLSSQSDNQTHQFSGKIIDFYPERMMVTVSIRNQVNVGDTLELLSPPPVLLQKFKLEKMFSRDDQEILVAHGGGQEVRMGIPFTPSPFSLLRKAVGKVSQK